MPFISSVSANFSAIGGRGKKAVISFIATGGTQTTSGGYVYHVFSSPGTFSISRVGAPGVVEWFMVAGGGGGGNGGDSGSGGGGAGGLVWRMDQPVSATSYPIVIGAGGSGGTGQGGNSTAFGYTAIGGGYGSGRTYPGGPGGNGGGGGSYSGGIGVAGNGIQPSQSNPGANQIGFPGYSPNGPENNPHGDGTAYGYPAAPAPNHFGGSSNPTSNPYINPTLTGSPTAPTFISSSPLSSGFIARGGGFRYGNGGGPLGGFSYPENSYGSGGAGALGGGIVGFGGVCVIRYPAV